MPGNARWLLTDTKILYIQHIGRYYLFQHIGR